MVFLGGLLAACLGVIIVVVTSGVVVSGHPSSLGSEDYWLDTRLSLQAIGLGRSWECPTEHVLPGSGTAMLVWSGVDYYAGRDMLVSAVNQCADTTGCASVSTTPTTGYIAAGVSAPVCGSELFVSLSVDITLCGVRVPNGGELSLAATDAAYAVAPGNESSPACTPPQALASQPWYASGCGGGTFCLLPPSVGQGIDFVDALVSGRGSGGGVLIPTTCVGATRNVDDVDAPPLTIGGTGLVNTTERGTCVCTEPDPAPAGLPAYPLFCSSTAPLWPSSVDDRPAVLPRIAPLRSPTYAGTPWSFPVLPVAGSGDALTLTLRRLTVGLLMHLTEDPVTLTSRPQSPDHIVVLLTRPGHPPASTPGVTPDVTIAVGGTTDALEELTRLCVEEADVVAAGGCKSWSTRPSADSWSSTDCSDADAPWMVVDLYMSATGDRDSGHAVTRDRMYAAGAFTGGVASYGSAKWYDNAVVNTEHATARACVLAGARWLLVLRAGMTGQVCTQPATGGVPSSVCTPSSRTRYGMTSTATGPSEPWTMEEFAVDAFFEDDAGYDIRVYETACVGTGADGGSLSVSFCACDAESVSGPDPCNGVLSDFIVSNVSSPDAAELGTPWSDDEAVVAALTAHHSALPPAGSLPTYGDVHAQRVTFGGAYGSCDDPDVDLVTPTLRHLIKTASFNGDDIVDPTTGSVPASTTDELLDIAMQLCANEAWQSGYENVEPWTCSGVSWRLAAAASECHEAPTWEFMVCTGSGGVNTSDVVPAATSWTPCQWPWNTDTPGPDVVWSPMLPGGVTSVCVDCVCTPDDDDDDGAGAALTQSCRPAAPEELSTFPGGLLSGGSGSVANTAWDVAWGLGLQPYEVFWDSFVFTGGITPLYGDTSRTEGQGGDGTLHYTVRVIRVTSRRSAASLASRTFWVRHAGDAAWAAMATCSEAFGSIVREVSWDPVRVCGSADPGVQPYGFLRVICGTESHGFPTFASPWTLTYTSSGCPADVDFRTDALHTLRPGVIRLVSGLTTALPRFPLQRWTALGGVPMNLMRPWSDGDVVDLSWVSAGCPDYTGSITRVSPGRGLTACPNGAVTRAGTGHGQPPMTGAPIPTDPSREFVATRTWRGLSGACPPGSVSVSSYMTQYFLPSIGQEMQPLGRLDAVTTLATHNALEACLGSPLCNGVYATSRFGSWNPIVPQSSSFMTVQWAVTTCSSVDSDDQETSFSIADDATPSTNAAECGRNAPVVLQSNTFDKRSVTASLRGVFSSVGFVPCAVPVAAMCMGALPDDLYGVVGIFGGQLDISAAPQPFVSTCVRSGARNSTCTCARTVTTASGCSACDDSAWEGGLANATAIERPYESWIVATPGVDDAMDCQAKAVNLCAPRGVFTGWDPSGTDPEPWCAACSAPWSGTNCRTCSGCHPDPAPHTTRTAESAGVVCADSVEAALDGVCDCSGSSEWRKPRAGAPIGDAPDTRSCSVCADDRQFARPFKYFTSSLTGLSMNGDFPGWCWSVLESEADTHPVAAGGPVITGGWCEPYVNVSASNEANECVYNASPLCFDPNTAGCVDWGSTCNAHGRSNETASKAAGACVCESPFAGTTCSECDADHPYDYMDWSRSQYPEACYAWPEVCDARAAVSMWSSDLLRGWVSDADGDLTPSAGNANHPYSITEHCLCVGNPRGPSKTDCIVCEPGRTIYNHVVGEGSFSDLVKLCLLPHPAVAAGGSWSEVCGPGGSVGSVLDVTTTAVCVCDEEWAHSDPDDPVSPCTVCASDGYVLSSDGQTCAACPGFGDLSYMSTCPSGTGSCAWNASAPVFMNPIWDLSVIGYGAAVCDCPGGRREWGPLVMASETHGVPEAAAAEKRSPCGPCMPGGIGVTCETCAVNCNHGECAVITEGFRPGCTCDPMWELSLTHLPWYMQPCSSCANGSVAVAWTGIADEVFGLDTFPNGVPTSCVVCPHECPTTCVWRPDGLGPGGNESGLACPCALESRVTVPRAVTADEAAAVFPDVYPDSRVWVCGGCTPPLLGDPEAGYACGATCAGGCGGDDAGTCTWNVTHTSCVCEDGYTHSPSGGPGDACTSCAADYVLASFSIESNEATCAACPTGGECPSGSRCAWSPPLDRSVCTCADVWRALTTATGLCGDCIPGRRPSDGPGGTACTAVCPSTCGPGGVCVTPPVTNPPAVHADCACLPGYVHAVEGLNSSACSVCAPGYELDPATGTCHLCRAPCEFGMSCVWDDALQSPRCDCAPGHFREAVVTLPDNSSWTGCSSSDGCSDTLHVGPLCSACPTEGCGPHGTCAWSPDAETSVCVCDDGWTHVVADDERTACTACAPGALGPRCESCGGDGCSAWPHTECSYSVHSDSVECSCIAPYTDPLGGSDCSACAASLPQRVGPGCEPCRVGGCGPGGVCGWSAAESSPVCVCSSGFVNTDGPTSACRPCHPDTETASRCVPCPSGCSSETGERCVEVSVAGQSVTSACSCMPGYSRYDDDRMAYPHCYMAYEREAITAALAPSPDASPGASPSGPTSLLDTAMGQTVVTIGSLVVIVGTVVSILMCVRHARRANDNHNKPLGSKSDDAPLRMSGDVSLYRYNPTRRQLRDRKRW